MTTPNYFGWTDDKADARILRRETRYVNEQIKAYEVREEPIIDWRNPEFLHMLINLCDTDPAHIRTSSEAEIERDNEWLEDGPLYFWGGEVCEYRPDSHLESQYDEMNGDMEMPF